MSSINILNSLVFPAHSRSEGEIIAEKPPLSLLALRVSSGSMPECEVILEESRRKVSFDESFSRNVFNFLIGYPNRMLSEPPTSDLRDDLARLMQQSAESEIQGETLTHYTRILARCCFNPLLLSMILQSSQLDQEALARAILALSPEYSDADYLSLLDAITRFEIDHVKEFELLFRENSLATKLMKASLSEALVPALETLEKKLRKVKKPDALLSDKGVKKLARFSKDLLETFYTMPLEERAIKLLAMRRDALLASSHKDHWSQGVSDALFLRGVAPHFANPDPTRSSGHRILALKISKLIVKLSNAQQFDASSSDRILNDALTALSPLHAEYLARYRADGGI